MDWEKIKEIREKKQMTQVEVSRAIGVSLSVFRYWEIGGGRPRPENLKKLKEVLTEESTEQ